MLGLGELEYQKFQHSVQESGEMTILQFTNNVVQKWVIKNCTLYNSMC